MSVLDKIARMKQMWIRDGAVDAPTDYDWLLDHQDYSLQGCPRCGWQEHERRVGLMFIRCKRCQLKWSAWSDANSEGTRTLLEYDLNYYPAYWYIKDDDGWMVDITNGEVIVAEGVGDYDRGCGLFIVRVERAED